LPALVTAAPHWQHGQIVGSIGVVTDMSQQRAVQRELEAARDQAVEASRLKSEFLATMSHEIRTPMNGVIGMAELLLDTPLSADQRELALTVHGQSQALLAIINDILDFSKIESGKLEIERVAFSVHDLVAEVAEVIAPAARGRGLTYHIEIDSEIPEFCVGDPVRLRQVLVNLAGNAVKFTHQGGLTVRLSLAERSPVDMVLQVEVVDTGVGIAPGAQARLFDPFTQADGSTTRRYGGTGLGLAISRRLVELMGGQIGVRSQPGVGSTFWFTVPMSVSQTRALPVPDHLTDTLAGLRVLIASDDRAHADQLRRHFTAWSLETRLEPDPDAALGELIAAAERRNPWQVVVIDYSQETISATRFASELRACPELAGCVLVLLRDHRSAAHEPRPSVAGFDTIVPKPVRASRLLDSLSEIMAGRARPSYLPDHVRPAFTPGEREIVATVLLAEDNPVNQRLARLQLEKLGLEVETAADGREAVALLQRAAGRYRVVLMDCQMPEMDGFTATGIIRRNEGEHGRRVPIIAMTANALSGDRERCLEAGMDDYISKPVNLERLQATLSQWIPELQQQPVAS
jgi:signal transduction histidine kinase/DNA-binding response OmpR family regulator